VSSFPGSPRLLRAALVSVDLSSPAAVPFQYNPDRLTRSITPSFESSGPGGADVPRFAGAPTEAISLEAVFDASDARAQGGGAGVLPQLSALEILAYPSTLGVLEQAALAATGVIEVVPPAAPLLVFSWGAGRTVPVRIESFEIEETVHDAMLVPIHATVALRLRVLSYSDVPPTHPAYALFLAYQTAKAGLGLAGQVAGWRP
jgi:hypothetical protein